MIFSKSSVRDRTALDFKAELTMVATTIMKMEAKVVILLINALQLI